MVILLVEIRSQSLACYVFMSYQIEENVFFFFFHLRKLTGFQFIAVVSVVNISLLDIIAVSLSKDPQTPESMTHFM